MRAAVSNPDNDPYGKGIDNRQVGNAACTNSLDDAGNHDYRSARCDALKNRET